MINCSPKINRTRKNDISDSVSQESLRRTSKKLERTNSNKSNRSNQSLQSNQSKTVNSFYVKNVFLTHLHQHRKDIQQDDKSTEKKVRTPTPCKSRKQINKNNADLHKDDTLKVKSIELSLKISELQTKLRDFNHKNSRLEYEVRKCNDKICKLEGEVMNKQKKITSLLNENMEEKKKIFQLQRAIMENQTSLKYANNNLDRLKKAINQNKLTDLKKDNAQKKRQIDRLMHDLARLSQELMSKEQINIRMEKELMTLRQRIQVEKNCRNQSMKEKFLEKEIIKLKEQLKSQRHWDQSIIHEHSKILEHQKHSLEGEIKKLRIQLDYMQRKHTEQLKLFCKTKNQEIQIVQSKYNELYKRYKEFKDEVKQKNESKLRLLRENKNYLKPETCNRENLLNCDHSRNRKNSFLFELSPE